MLNDQTNTASTINRTRNNIQQDDRVDHDHESPMIIRDIHALTPPTSRHVSSSLSIASSSSTDAAGENFTTISREFNALVLAGSRIRTENQSQSNLGRIGEEQINTAELEETNPLAIVLDRNPLQLPPPRETAGGEVVGQRTGGEVATMQRVRKEEAESKINAWKNAKIAKVNNRFKREEAVIRSWEDDKAHKALSRMKKVERKLEEKRAKAMEKMQNERAKAHRKAEERMASAEAKRATKVARVVEIANLMKVMGKPPAKRSFF